VKHLAATQDAIKLLLTPKQIGIVKMFVKGQNLVQIEMATNLPASGIQLQMRFARKRLRCENNMQLAAILAEAGMASARD
jgi:DNA-binding NarL/FixJ family response regulator